MFHRAGRQPGHWAFPARQVKVPGSPRALSASGTRAWRRFLSKSSCIYWAPKQESRMNPSWSRWTEDPENGGVSPHLRQESGSVSPHPTQRTRSKADKLEPDSKGRTEEPLGPGVPQDLVGSELRIGWGYLLRGHLQQYFSSYWKERRERGRKTETQKQRQALASTWPPQCEQTPVNTSGFLSTTRRDL